MIEQSVRALAGVLVAYLQFGKDTYTETPHPGVGMVTTNLMLWVPLHGTSIPSRHLKENNIPCHFLLQKLR